MMGVSFDSQSYEENRGLIPRTMEYLFESIEREREGGVNFCIRCSYLEIYNEQIIDLLNKNSTNLQLRQDTRKGVYVEGITEEFISKSEQAMDVLYRGTKSRHVAATTYNDMSSRSHSVFTLQIQSKSTKNGIVNTKSRQFNFIDLAGSERTKLSTGDRLKEGCQINKSLMNLASVINSLSQISEGKQQHVNYRNSKLTFLLKDSLGGNSKTNLIANISPLFTHYQETLSTLGFARRAKLIKRDKASINQDSTGNLDSLKNQIKRLNQEIITLMTRLQGTQGVSSMTVKGQGDTQITNMMRQYVSEEVDKQAKMQVEILRLNGRIQHLQKGIKQYSSNQVHLRMIISVYEDKIKRLKDVEKELSNKVNTLSSHDSEAKVVIEYFKNEKQQLEKEIQSLRKQTEGGRFIKQLMKEAKILKQEGEDETLKDLLVKNSNFLSEIQFKLDEMKTKTTSKDEQKSQLEIQLIQQKQQFSKKQEEYLERIEQASLQYSQIKKQNEESQRLLQEAISLQISMEDKVKVSQQQAQILSVELKNVRESIVSITESLNSMKKSTQEEKIELSKTIKQQKQAINTLEQEKLQLENQLTLMSNKLKVSSMNQTNLQSQLNNMNSVISQLQKTKAQIEEQLRSQTSATQEKEAIMSQLKEENDKLNHNLSSINEKYNSRLTDINKCQKNIDKLTKTCADHLKDIELFNQTIRKLQKQAEERDIQVKEYRSLNQQLLLEKQEIQEQNYKLRSMELEASQLKHVLKQEQLSKDQYQALLEKQNERTEHLCNRNKHLEAQIKKIQAQLLEERTSKSSLSSKLQRAEKDLSEAIAEGKNQAKIAKEAAQKMEELLEAKQEQFLALSQQIQLVKQSGDDKVKSLTKTLNQIESHQSKLEEEKEALMRTVNQLKCSLKNMSHAESNLKEEKKVLTTIKKELEQCNQTFKDELKKKNIQILEKEKSISGLHQELDCIALERSKQKAQIATLVQHVDRLTSTNLKLQTDKMDLSCKVTFLTGQVSELRNEVKNRCEELSKYEQMYQKVNRQNNQITNEFKQRYHHQSNQIQRLKQSLEKQKNDKEAILVSLRKAQEQNQASNSTANCIKADNLELHRIIEKRDKQICRLQEEVQQKQTLKEQINKLSQKTKQKEEEAALATAELTRLKCDFKLLKDEMISQDAHKKEERELQNQMNEEKDAYISELEQQKEQLQAQLQNIKHHHTSTIMSQANIKSEVQALTNICKQLEQLNKSNQTQLQDKVEMLISLNEQVKNISRQKGELQEELAHIQQQSKSNQTTIDQLKDLVHSLQTQKQMFKVRVEENLLKTSKLQNELNDKNRHIIDAEESNNSTISELQNKINLQSKEIQKLRGIVREEQGSKEQLFTQFCKEKQTNSNLKMIFSNSEEQIKHLEVELEEKDNIYKKLLEKIAKNDNDSKKTTNSQHYLKTVELLEKSRSEQLQLRRQNQDLKKTVHALKQALEQKQQQIKEVERRAQAYSLSMSKKIEQIQSDYIEMEKNQERLLKQKRNLEKSAHDNEVLKQQIKLHKFNASKMVQKVDNLEGKLKKSNFDYVQIQKQYEELKKSQLSNISTDDKTTYINRLKAQLAALKTEKVLLNDTLSKEREERLKLKADIRYNKQGLSDNAIKAELDKKIGESKNLTDLIFQIMNQLKISVVEPKTKLESIKNIILSTIKQKNNQIKILKEKIKQFELDMVSAKHKAEHSKQPKALSVATGKHQNIEESAQKLQKEKNSSYHNDLRQKTKYFQNYYARFRQAAQSNRSRH